MRKKSVSDDYDLSLLPKMTAHTGAPWNLCSATGVLLALSPTSDAASVTARAMWGRVALVASGNNFDVFVAGKLRGKIVRTKKRIG